MGLALAIAIPGLALASPLAAHAARHSARRHAGQEAPSKIGVPPQQDVVLPQGQVVVFLTCLGTSPCSGVLRLHLGAAEAEGVNLPPPPREGRRHRRLASLSPLGHGGLVLARRRVALRQKRVTPVTLQLPPAAMSILRSTGSLSVRALVRGRGGVARGLIVLRLAGSGVGAA